MSEGKASRQKGNRAERAIDNLQKERGFKAERALSGSAGGSYLGDLTVPIAGDSRVVEVKVRAKGFRQLYDRLVNRDILIVMADRCEPLVVLPLALAADILGKAGAA
jgi:Holliday junction resolvase